MLRGRECIQFYIERTSKGYSACGFLTKISFVISVWRYWLIDVSIVQSDSMQNALPEMFLSIFYVFQILNEFQDHWHTMEIIWVNWWNMMTDLYLKRQRQTYTHSFTHTHIHSKCTKSRKHTLVLKYFHS